MDILVTQHCEQSRPYPRPQEACPDCGATMILCWGPLRKPYWRHLSNTGRGCLGSGESLTHKMAKRYLTNYLNSGGTIQSQPTCQRPGVKCNIIWQPIMISLQSLGVVKFMEEYSVDLYDNSSKLQRIIYDIAGLDCNDQMVVGIEIRHTHVTNRVPNVYYISWLEVSAGEVLQELDISSQPAMISLTKLNNVIGQYCNDECHNLVKRYAEQLGYYCLDYPYPNESFRLVEAALKGRYLCPAERWYISPGDDYSPYLWSSFLSMKVCIRCEKPQVEIKYFRPYCISCYKKTIKEDKDYQKTIAEDGNVYPIRCITVQEKSDLRSRFAWLNNIPGNWHLGSPCSFCKEMDTSYPHKSYVWWFGDKKRCCTSCLEHIDTINSTNLASSSSTPISYIAI